MKYAVTIKVCTQYVQIPGQRNTNPKSVVDLGLSQIYPIWDEDKEEERTAVAASFANSHLVILRDDSSLLLLQAEANGDLDEITLSDEITAGKWRFCSLYRDQCQFFNRLSSRLGAGDATSLMFLVSQEYKLFVSRHGPDQERSLTKWSFRFSVSLGWICCR